MMTLGSISIRYFLGNLVNCEEQYKNMSHISACAVSFTFHVSAYTVPLHMCATNIVLNDITYWCEYSNEQSVGQTDSSSIFSTGEIVTGLSQMTSHTHMDIHTSTQCDKQTQQYI